MALVARNKLSIRNYYNKIVMWNHIIVIILMYIYYFLVTYTVNQYTSQILVLKELLNRKA